MTGALPRVGPYQLVRLLGEGGMGTVYVAEQVEPVRRTVALKLSRAGLESNEAQQRFRAERQALALLDHPNIARVFDAGSSDEGRPWFAMELVDGVPITQWAAQSDLDLEQRIRLLLPLCDAIEHAHRKGVIHRDLKPSNILVVDVEGIGLPKIIDFGIAKLAELSNADTESGMLLGTPEYMSPEQAALGAIDIDTRVDVYALGLVLYELLTGALPIPVETLRSLGFHEMCRRIREDEAPAPSVRFDPATSIHGSQWRRRLRGDLDAVLLKALAKDRGRRYESMAAFAADLRRFLDGEPVAAQPPSLRYRAVTLVRRHRAVVLAGAAVAIALLAASALATHGLIEARRGEAQATTAAVEAQRERDEAEATMGFLVELFRAADPRQQPGLDLTARELLERGVARIDNLEAQPGVQASLLTKLGDLYWVLGDAGRAEPLLRRALALRADDPAGRIEVLNRLAGLLRDNHDYEEAAALYRQALDLLASLDRLGTPQEVTLLNNYGILLVRTRAFDEADAVYSRGIALIEAHAEADPEGHQGWRNNVANLLGNLAQVRHQRGDTVGAIDAGERALAMFERQLPDEHPRLAVLHNNLAFLQAALGRYGTALRHAERAVAINAVALPAEHPTVAAHLLNKGQIQVRLGRFEAAEQTLIQSLEIYRATRGANSYDTTRPLGWLALAAHGSGNTRLALQRGDETCALIAASDHPSAPRDLAVCRRRQTVFLDASGDRQGAQKAAEAAWLSADATGEDGERAQARLLQALILLRVGDVDAAQTRWEEALRLGDCADAPCVLDQAQELVTRATWWLTTGDFDRAFAALALAIEHPRWTPWMLDDHVWDGLRSDPRWSELQTQLAGRIANHGQ